MQTRSQCYWPRHRTRSGSPASSRRAARSPDPPKTRRFSIERPFIQRRDDIVRTATRVDVPDTCTSCHASPTALSGTRLCTALRVPASSWARATLIHPNSGGTTTSQCYGHRAPRRSNGRRRGRGPTREAAARRKASWRTVLPRARLDQHAPGAFCHSFISYIRVLNVENSTRFRCRCSCHRIRACQSGSWTVRS